jgi:hypothetical protein
MKNQHFKWVPHFLDDDLRAKRLKGAQQLVGVLEAQGRCPFRDLITGNETWVYLAMKPETIWLPADAELPVPVKRTIASEGASNHIIPIIPMKILLIRYSTKFAVVVRLLLDNFDASHRQQANSITELPIWTTLICRRFVILNSR